jgi:hypothetical protein
VSDDLRVTVSGLGLVIVMFALIYLRLGPLLHLERRAIERGWHLRLALDVLVLGLMGTSMLVALAVHGGR